MSAGAGGRGRKGVAEELTEEGGLGGLLGGVKVNCVISVRHNGGFGGNGSVLPGRPGGVPGCPPVGGAGGSAQGGEEVPVPPDGTVPGCPTGCGQFLGRRQAINESFGYLHGPPAPLVGQVVPRPP